MREIKFRAWDKRDHVMFNSVGQFSLNEISKSPWEWMQYTGLKDKNGTEIYEGDICNYDYGFDSGQQPQKIWFEHGSFKYGISSMYDMGRELEVIGNIYETPELLK